MTFQESQHAYAPICKNCLIQGITELVSQFHSSQGQIRGDDNCGTCGAAVEPSVLPTDRAERVSRLDSITRSVQQQADIAITLSQHLIRIAESIHALSRHIDAVQQQVNTIQNQVAMGELRLNRSVVVLHDHTALVRAVNGLKIYVDTEDAGVAPHLLTGGEFDPHITKVLEDLVQPGMNAVDVGANCGWFTLVMAARLGPSGKLDAVEPDSNHTKLMNMSLAANGFADWVRVHSAAAVESDRPVHLYRNPVNRGNHCIHVKSAEGMREKVPVPGIAMDSILTHPIQVMKLDAEGSEPLVLAGMRQTLARSPELKIVMEFYPELIQQGGADPAKFLQEIAVMGFRYRLITMAGKLESCHPDYLLSEGQISNLLLTR